MWLDLLVAYGHPVDVAVATAHIWAPVLLGAASLGWHIRADRSRGRLRRTRPDPSGQDSDTPSDIQAFVPFQQP